MTHGADSLCESNISQHTPKHTLADLYQGYIDCLNAQDWDNLGKYVADEVGYNGEMVGLDAYRQAREKEFREIPDLRFEVRLLVSDQKTVASRLEFDISPSGEFLGVPVNGKRVRFSENVFYEYEGDKIIEVWSVLDKAAIEAQLSRP
ncbi:ester cyclase [Rhizobium leguminosarum]|uniref:Ester cyclase n=1 Tax=Rhizobium beringeri TaxID=3019934 RepID=A0ABY1XHU2_9HYPH|nr:MULTISPECIES: ester cyclase [Rhizobium]TAU38040.1 ester cyclase [Rhizobium leguminosarum]TBC54685.1 ester cyclase [Rhizobium leguminosarum]TBC91824.1 ester cyclase [Rhizobium leguminosarum]TBE58217.1 ester cyclase [Rhizobium beringeri]WSH30915.1 ester cyclase [Rhizobium beringeri]